MGVMRMMIVAMMALGFASNVMADIETPEWEVEIREPAMPAICKKILAVRNSPTLKGPAQELAKELYDLLGNPANPIRKATCGKGEGSISLLAGVDVVDQLIWTLREAELTPHDVLPGAAGGPEGIRAALLKDVRQQVVLNGQGAGAENNGANNAVQRAIEEYHFTPEEVGLTPAEARESSSK